MHVILTLFTLLAFLSTMAATGHSLPIDTTTGKVIYRTQIEVSKKLSQERIYATLQNWFSTHPEVCNRCNKPENTDGVNTKNYIEVQRVFNNSSPLQSIDPESTRMAIRIIDRYFADEDEALKVVYTEYYVVITVSGNKVTAEISDIRYNHFNHRSYMLQRIGNWSDVLSFDSVNTIEHLLANGQHNDELLKLFTYINEDIQRFFAQMQNHLQNTAALVSAE